MFLVKLRKQTVLAQVHKTFPLIPSGRGPPKQKRKGRNTLHCMCGLHRVLSSSIKLWSVIYSDADKGRCRSKDLPAIRVAHVLDK